MESTVHDDRYADLRTITSLICATTDLLAALLSVNSLLQRDDKDGPGVRKGHESAFVSMRAAVDSLLKRLEYMNGLMGGRPPTSEQEPDPQARQAYTSKMTAMGLCRDVGKAFQACDVGAVKTGGMIVKRTSVRGWKEGRSLRYLCELNSRLHQQMASMRSKPPTAFLWDPRLENN